MRLMYHKNTVRLAFDMLIREGVIIQNASSLNRVSKILNCDYNELEIGENTQEYNIEAQKGTLSKKLYTKIKQYISKNYKLNDKIMPNEEFAKMFNVSVRTVNDAMKRLNKEKNNYIFKRKIRYKIYK